MRKFQKIVVLTGAGISAESGIPTFRTAGGLWEQNPMEEVGTASALKRDRWRVNGFFNQCRLQAASIQPNPAHFALARLEQAFADDFLLVTQNVDALHEKAGSQRVIHMHGFLDSIQCDRCYASYPFNGEATPQTPCEKCGATGWLRPDLTLFGEIPMQMDRINAAANRCDLFISIGTSGAVYPAAGLVHLANLGGAYAIEVNLDDTLQSLSFDECITGPAGQVVPALVDRLLAA